MLCYGDVQQLLFAQAHPSQMPNSTLLDCGYVEIPTRSFEKYRHQVATYRVIGVHKYLKFIESESVSEDCVNSVMKK